MTVLYGGYPKGMFEYKRNRGLGIIEGLGS
jgi:hypothetical protein